MDISEDKVLIRKAVKGLRTAVNSRAKKESKTNLKQLFADDGTDSNAKVNLLVSFIKIPEIPSDGKVKPVTIRSSIPHSFVDQLTDVLLITNDIYGFHKRRNDYQASLNAYKDLLREHNALSLVTEIMPLQQLIAEYPDFESKRNLCSQFDVVLCEHPAICEVPVHLGKAFYKSKKRPIRVDLKVTNVRHEIKSALSKSYLYLDLKGSCSMAQVGRLNQTNDKLAENILSTFNDWKPKLPGGWDNVRSIHLKTNTSKSIPLVMSLRLPNEIGKVDHPKDYEDPVIARDYLSTLKGDQLVEVRKSGEIFVVPADEKKRTKFLANKEKKDFASTVRYDPVKGKIMKGNKPSSLVESNKRKRKTMPRKSLKKKGKAVEGKKDLPKPKFEKGKVQKAKFAKAKKTKAPPQKKVPAKK